jgi:soluble lytic murein transglycosylase-like protein
VSLGRWLPWLLPLLAAAPVAVAGPAGPAAVGGLWGYVDGQGVAHLAPAPLDGRFQPLLEAPGGASARAPQKVPGKTDAAAGLLTWLEIAPEVRAVRPWLQEAARRHGVDRELLVAVIAVESGFDAKAVSPRGALGLMQITPQTGERYAPMLPGDARPLDERLLDARLNIHAGARMLADLIRRFGRIDIALAAWNAGEGAVRRHGGQVPPIDETQAHVHQVLELYWALLQRSQNLRAKTLKVY